MGQPHLRMTQTTPRRPCAGSAAGNPLPRDGVNAMGASPAVGMPRDSSFASFLVAQREAGTVCNEAQGSRPGT